MASHHTKDKGDLGVVMVIADLVRHGVDVYVPLSEHQPSDLIAADRRGRIARVQVKYRTLERTGIVSIDFRNTYSDSHGVHSKLADHSQFDCYAVYCPQTEKVYYLRIDDIPKESKQYVSLRIVPTANNQKKKVIMASDYAAFGRIFD